MFLEISKPEFLRHVTLMGEYLKSELLKLRFDSIKDIRGVGLMIGIELHDSYETQSFVDICRQYGLLCISAGSNTIRLVPPLIIQKHHIDAAISVFKIAFQVSLSNI